MVHKTARTLFLVAVAGLAFGVLHRSIPGTVPAGADCAWATPVPHRSERVVFLAGDLEDEGLIAFTTNLAASGHTGVALLDGSSSAAGNRAFLAVYRPDHVIPVGDFPEGADELRRRLGVSVAPPLAWNGRPSGELWKTWFPRAEQVVVCPAEPRRLLLQAACLAGNLRVPLWILHGKHGDTDELRHQLGEWKTRRILAAGLPHSFSRGLPNVHVLHLPDEEAVATLARRHLPLHVQTLVVANPSDTRTRLHGVSVLAPFVAVQRHGALLLTNDAGDNSAAIVREALKSPRLHAADNLVLVADLDAIPLERRPNPVPGKDPYIEMEPLTPRGAEPFSFATGRLFHEDPGVILLVLARQRLLDETSRQGAAPVRKALVASNAGGSLPLLETISRNTVRELRNRGYQTTALFGDDVTRDELRRQVPRHDIFLWEGHHNTLIKEWRFHEWTEPLPPALIFLQSCLTLIDYKAYPLLERGAVGVVGSSTRMYSASGGAFALAYFNGLLYEGQSLGGSLRRAKNFLLAYSLLKDKRLGKDAKMGGANLRSAWAFTLWGDPTVKLPAPAVPVEALAAVRHAVHGNTIVVSVPDVAPERIRTQGYESQLRPNTCLAGLLGKAVDEDQKKMVPFIFVEVALPKAPLNRSPRIRSRLPDSHYVFCWDQRRRCGYLLVTPRARDHHELRFHLEWETPGVEASAAILQMQE